MSEIISTYIVEFIVMQPATTNGPMEPRIILRDFQKRLSVNFPTQSSREHTTGRRGREGLPEKERQSSKTSDKLDFGAHNNLFLFHRYRKIEGSQTNN